MLRKLYADQQFLVGFDTFLRSIVIEANVDLGSLTSTFARPTSSYDPSHFAFDEVMTWLAESLNLNIEFYKDDNPAKQYPTGGLENGIYIPIYYSETESKFFLLYHPSNDFLKQS